MRAAGHTLIQVATASTTPAAVGIWAVRRGAAAADLLAPLALAIVTTLIAFNKVGSPQFISWLAVPVVLGLATKLAGRGRPFAVPAAIVLLVAALTQSFYPYLYDELLSLNPLLLVILTLRNLLLFVLLGWAVRAVVLTGRHASSVRLPPT